MIGKLSPALSNLVGSLAMNECHDEITQRRHDLWSMARAKLRAVFAKGDIAHIMERVLNAPMPTHQGEQASRTGCSGVKIGDEVDHLFSGLVAAAHRDRAGELCHLRQVRPVGQVSIHGGADFDAAQFDAPTLVSRGAVLLIGGIRVSKLGSQISREGGLVLLDREHSLATQGIDPLEKVGLSVHGIGRTHTPS